MPSIDERVVAMSFENTVFETRVATTMATLSKLDSSIKNIGSTNGLQNIEAAANKVTLQSPMSALDKLKAKLGFTNAGTTFTDIERASGKVSLEQPSKALDNLKNKLDHTNAGTTFTDMENAGNRVSLSGLTNALDGVKGHLSGLETAASVAFGNIASQAAMKGASFAKSFAFGPIKQGFEEYGTNLGSIQTILANTQDSGGNLKTVNQALGELNKYSDKTIYNFSEMAKNIGTFTAAGVKLKPATESIKGISNLAALSGSNSQQASTAMYQLSQAISSGKVGLQDWNSVVNAGMGGAVFQKALMRTAGNMGTVEKGAIKIDKATGKATINGESFRESIAAKPGQKSWLTSDVLVKTLGQFTGDMTDAQLAAQGFNASQIKAIQTQAKTAQAAATEVKTLPQVFDVARETIGSGWAKTFQTIFGDFGESKKTFTNLSNTINGFINVNSDARNKVLGDWKALGGRTELIKGIKAAFEAVMSVLKPIKDAFREVFPAKTGKDLFELTKRFTELMRNLKLVPKTAENLKRTFAGVFAAFHIGWTIVKDLAKVFFDLLGIVGKGSGGFLNFTGGVGDFLVALDKAITKGGVLNGFFKGLTAVLSVPLRLLSALGRAIFNLFGGADNDKAAGFEDSLKGVGDKLGPLKGVIDAVVGAWNKLVEVVGKVKTALDPWFSEMAQKLSGVGDILADAFKGLNFDRIMEGLKVGFLGGIFVTLKKALGGGGASGLLGSLKGTLSGVNGLLGGFTKQMEGMQSKLHAEALLAIAAAVAVLAGGIYILSTIDGDKLAKAMTAVAVGLGELMGAMKLMTSGMGKMGILQLPVIAAAMIGLALAVVILSGAVKIFSTMSWEDIAKGLVGVAGSIVGIALGMKLMPGGGKGLAVQAAGLVLLAVGLNLIATAVTIFSKMSWEDLVKGLAGAVLSMVGISKALLFMPPDLPLIAAGLILLGIGLNAVAIAVRSFGSMDLGTLVKGLIAMTAAIAGIGLAVSFIPPTIALSAVGLLLVGQAMVVTAGAIALLGSMSIGTLVKGIAALAATLIVLAGGLTLMIVALPGAAALMVAAVALAALVPALGILGTMKWSTIFKGLAAIALVMATIGIAGILAAPGLIALGIALIPLGLGFMVVATAAKIFASAIKVLSDEGQKGLAVLLAAVTAFIALIPNLILSFVKGLVSIVDQVVTLLPKLVIALGKIIGTVIAFVTEQAPKLAVAIGVLITAILKVLVDNTPQLVAAGAKLLLSILSGLSSNIGAITTKAAEVIIKFMNALTSKAPQLVAAGARLLVSFLNGISSKIGQVVAAGTNMIVKFIGAVAKGYVRIISAGQTLMLKLIGAIAGFVPRLIAKGTSIIVSFLNGIENAIPRIKNKAVSVARTFVNNLADGLVSLANVGFRAIIRFLNGLARAIRANDDEMINAGMNVGDAIGDGIKKGLRRVGPSVIHAAEDLILALPKKALKILNINSPSKVFAEIGKFTMMGFAQGLVQNGHLPIQSIVSAAHGIVTGVASVLGIHSPSTVMKELGKAVNEGFAQGLEGSVSDIRTAFKTLNDKLKEQIKTSRDTIKSEQKAIKAELAKDDPDMNAIRASQNVIRENERIVLRSAAAQKTLVDGLKHEKTELINLTKEFDTVSKKLDKAKQILASARQERDDARKSFESQYSATPTIQTDATGQASLANYTKQLAARLAATKSYAETLQKLRELGLDDLTYKKLLEQGLEGKKFAEQLLAGGKGGIDALNDLDSQLVSAAKDLSQTASKNLYQAGVDAARGIVNGLKSQKDDIAKQMDDLARMMVRAIKRRLKIKSPSQMFEEIGKLSIEGLSQGLKGNTADVENAARIVGESALSAMQKGLSGISGILDVDPVITPVMDLSQVKKDAQQLGDLTNVTPISAAASYQQAVAISTAQALDLAETAQAAQAGANIVLNQNNYSPDPLSSIELYRQTNNQLARLKSLVGA